MSECRSQILCQKVLVSCRLRINYLLEIFKIVALRFSNFAKGQMQIIQAYLCQTQQDTLQLCCIYSSWLEVTNKVSWLYSRPIESVVISCVTKEVANQSRVIRLLLKPKTPQAKTHWDREADVTLASEMQSPQNMWCTYMHPTLRAILSLEFISEALVLISQQNITHG